MSAALSLQPLAFARQHPQQLLVGAEQIGLVAGADAVVAPGADDQLAVAAVDADRDQVAERLPQRPAPLAQASAARISAIACSLSWKWTAFRPIARAPSQLTRMSSMNRQASAGRPSRSRVIS